jgi:hypothetical protein
MRAFAFLFAGSSLCLLMACGGGGSSSNDEGGIVGSGARSSGPITATGSRVVAGTRWNLASATISSDGSSSFSESDLPLGRFVVVDGTRSADGLTGTATSVRFDSILTGPIDSGSVMDLGGGQTGFRIFGIPVIADSNTFLDPPSLVIAGGQVVEVDGLVGASDEVRATRVELRANAAIFGATEIEAKGIARNASATNFELDIDRDGVPDLTVLLDSPPCQVPTERDPSDLDLAASPFVVVDGVLTAATTICADATPSTHCACNDS